MDFYKYAEIIDDQGISPQVIADAIADHTDLKNKTFSNYGRYTQNKKDVPILTREFEGAAAKKINNKIANDYFGEIIDTKTGYMFGEPMLIGYEKKESNYEVIKEEIRRFGKINNIDDLNSEISKFAGMCGYDAGLCYIDKEGQERVMRIDPWEAIVISKTSLTEPEYGIVYYTTWDEKARVEFYDAATKTIFEGEDFDSLEEVKKSAKKHMFKHCPLFGIPNNNELLGDADKVLSLIDAYDSTISNMTDEAEQFRLAYLLYIGYEPDDIEAMIKTGALYIPTADNNERIEWLTKSLDPAYIEALMNRLEANITRFSKHVNFTDAAFGSDITGPAMRYKLFALETKSKYFERKHQAATQYMYKVIGSSWITKGIPFDYTLLSYKYTRNIPVNLLDEAQTAITMMGVTSKRTALEGMSSVPDVDEELRRIEEEKGDIIDLDDPELKDDPVNDNKEVI